MTRRQTEWRDRVERWRESGKAASEFAESEGVKEGTLRHWAWRFERGRNAGVSGRVMDRVPAFVEVHTTAREKEGIEIVIHDDVRIRVPVGYDEETLRRVLALVESR